VSETYAREIQTEAYGAGLEGVLRTRHDVLFGIVNGADYSVWDPRVDRLLPYRYSAEDMAGKQKNKTALLKRVGLRVGARKRIPVVGMVSRLVEQKGLDIIEPALPEIMKMDLKLVILGTGEERYHKFLMDSVRAYPDRLAVELAFDNELAHLIEAGSDMFLMPSRFEPSGLNQIYSLRYGTVPIVRATGGLADTVVDAASPDGTGFVFHDYTPEALLGALRRAVERYNDRAAWADLIRRGMAADFSWNASAKKYVRMYRRAMELAGERRVTGTSARK
jgi:starch synthase